MKRLADALTGLRFVLGAMIALIGVTRQDAVAFHLLVWLTLAAWTSDWLDGPLARRSGFKEQTWLGQHDLEADLSITIALTIVLVARGLYLPVAVAVALILVWLGWRALFRQGRVDLVERGIWPNHEQDTEDSSFVQLAMAFIDGGFIYAVWKTAPELLKLVVLWVVAGALLNPRRSWARVRGFLAASKQVGSKSERLNSDQ